MAAVVDVGMGQQNGVNLPRPHRKGLVFIDVLPLLHAAVNQEMQPTSLQQGAAAGHLMVCT